MKRLLWVFLLGPVLVLAGETYNLNLPAAVKLALEKNESVLAAAAKLTEKKADRSAALSAFLPTVDLTGTYTRLGKVQEFDMIAPHDTLLPLGVYDIQTGQPIGYTDKIPVAIGADTVKIPMGQADNYDLRGTVKQTLFTGGKFLHAYNISRYTMEIENQNYRKTVQSVKFNVTQAFYQILTARDGVQLIRESFGQMERHVNQVEQLYKNGYISKLDLLRARVGLANLKTQLIRAENGYSFSRAGLKLAIGLQPDDSVAVAGELAYEPYTIAIEGAVDSALKIRPEILILQNTIGVTKGALHIEEANFSPNLFAAFNYDYKKPVTLSQNEWGTDWNVTVGFQLPIFSGFSRINKIVGRKAQVKQVQYGFEQLKKGIELEIEGAYLNLKQEEAILKSQEENRAQADEAMRIAEEQYKNGVISNLEYMDTQVTQLGAKTEYLSALSRYLIARAKLVQALGQGGSND
jgi:outer membrane protein TolC